MNTDTHSVQVLHVEGITHEARCTSCTFRAFGTVRGANEAADRHEAYRAALDAGAPA